MVATLAELRAESASLADAYVNHRIIHRNLVHFVDYGTKIWILLADFYFFVLRGYMIIVRNSWMVLPLPCRIVNYSVDISFQFHVIILSLIIKRFYDEILSLPAIETHL